jgi:hypothetical protein
MVQLFLDVVADAPATAALGAGRRPSPTGKLLPKMIAMAYSCGSPSA